MKQTLKQAAISIVIGAVVSFLTVLFQEFISFLNSIPSEIPGTVVAIVRYLIKTQHLT